VKYNSPEDPAADGSVLSPLVFTPGGRIGPAAESFLNRLARERAGRFIPVDEQPSRSALTAIYRSYRRRLVHAISRGLALQLSIYALERRVGPSPASALRAAYPSFVCHRVPQHHRAAHNCEPPVREPRAHARAEPEPVRRSCATSGHCVTQTPFLYGSRDARFCTPSSA
jgi:hypothetical protein